MKIKTSLTFRQEGTHKIFKKKVLWRIFERKRKEVTEDWRKLHNKELHDLNFSPDVGIILKKRKVMWSAHVAYMGEKPYRLVVGKSEGKCRNEWDCNMKVNLREIGYSKEVMNRFHMA